MSRVLASRLWVAVLLFSTAFILGLIVLILPRTLLRVEAGAAQHELAAITLDEASHVEVEYVHSMYGVLQKEIFAIGSGPVFRLVKVEFGSLAAALYYDPDPTSGVVFEEGAWVIQGSGKSYPVLKYRVSAGTGHILKARGQTIDLSAQSAGQEGLIQLKLDRQSRLSSLFTMVRAGMF